MSCCKIRKIKRFLRKYYFLSKKNSFKCVYFMYYGKLFGEIFFCVRIFIYLGIYEGDGFL